MKRSKTQPKQTGQGKQRWHDRWPPHSVPNGPTSISADVITVQLTPVWTELTVLQTRATEVDALVVQMAQAEAHMSELEEKVLEVEEKEDNHIAYLEAQLENVSLAEEDKKMDDEFEGKGAKAWKELGRGSPQPTMPPLTPVMPSTIQQADQICTPVYPALRAQDNQPK